MSRAVISLAIVAALAPTLARAAVERIVVTASGRADALDETPVAIAVVDGDAVRALGALRIGEALEAAPGVFFSGLNGPREIAQIRQPLAFDNRTLFLEDGAPLQSSVFFDQSALGYSVALASPGSIEVLRGPGTALYGSDAFSGVVHARSVAAPASFEAGLDARVGAFEAYDLRATVGGPLSEGQRARVTAAFAGEDGFREETAFNRGQAVARHEVDGTALDATSIFAFARYETESATAIPLDDLLAGSRASGLSPLVDPEAAVERGVYARAQTRLVWTPSERFSLEATPYYRRQDIEATATFQPATTPRTDALVRTFGALPRLYWTHDDDARTIAGLDVELTHFDRLTTQDAPDTVVFGALFPQGVQYDYRVGFRALSPYLQHERGVGPVRLTLGLRYDDLRYDFDNALPEIPGDALLQVEDRVDRFDALSPKAGAVWPLGGGHSLFARYARGFRIPRESDLYELTADQAEFELTPERVDSGEAGWRFSGDRVRTELLGYWAVSRDGVITDVQTAAGAISINAGSSRFAGLEASMSAELGGGLSASASFAFQDFRFRRRAADGPDPFDGNLIAEAPRTIGLLQLNWRPPSASDLNLTARLRHIGPWALNDANTLFTDNEFILTLLGEWRLTDRLVVDARLENVADAVYPAFADAPVFAPNGRGRPGRPRAFSAGARIVF